MSQMAVPFMRKLQAEYKAQKQKEQEAQIKEYVPSFWKNGSYYVTVPFFTDKPRRIKGYNYYRFRIYEKLLPELSHLKDIFPDYCNMNRDYLQVRTPVNFKKTAFYACLECRPNEDGCQFFIRRDTVLTWDSIRLFLLTEDLLPELRYKILMHAFGY